MTDEPCLHTSPVCPLGAEVFPAVPPPPALQDEEVDLLDCLEVLVRRRWLVAAGTLLCLLLSLGQAMNRPLLYEAQAIILPADAQD